MLFFFFKFPMFIAEETEASVICPRSFSSAKSQELRSELKSLNHRAVLPLPSEITRILLLKERSLGSQRLSVSPRPRDCPPGVTAFGPSSAFFLEPSFSSCPSLLILCLSCQPHGFLNPLHDRGLFTAGSVSYPDLGFHLLLSPCKATYYHPGSSPGTCVWLSKLFTAQSAQPRGPDQE